MDELIQKLEEAEGPSRELDADIAIALGKQHQDVWRWSKSAGVRAAIPSYTRSLDDAMTLVPDDCEFEVGSAKLVGTYLAKLVTAAEEYIGKGAKTPAIALTAAALKAIAHDKKQG